VVGPGRVAQVVKSTCPASMRAFVKKKKTEASDRTGTIISNSELKK
jgi:hypothetical protein